MRINLVSVTEITHDAGVGIDAKRILFRLFVFLESGFSVDEVLFPSKPLAPH